MYSQLHVLLCCGLTRIDLKNAQVERLVHLPVSPLTLFLFLTSLIRRRRTNLIK
jgi:hypothetical protein